MALVVAVFVTMLVLVLAYLCVVLWFLRGRQGGTRARIGLDGTQEMEILVRGRYRPDTVVVTKGIPVRLLFNRQEDTACSERVIFSVPSQERWLAPFATTAVQFVPTREGEFLFTCTQGMYQGHLVVQEPRPVSLPERLRHSAVLGFLSEDGSQARGRKSKRGAAEDATGQSR